MARPGLFNLTAVGDLLAAALFGLAAWGLYVLLRPVDKHLALLFLLLNLVGVGIQALSGLNQFAALLLLQRPDYLSVIPADQLQALAMFFLDLREKGFLIAQLFFGAWLFPLGYLVFKSGFLPRILGIVLMVHCCTWLSTVFLSFLFPGFTAITYVSYPLGFIAEVGLTLWLCDGCKGSKAGPGGGCCLRYLRREVCQDLTGVDPPAGGPRQVYRTRAAVFRSATPSAG